MAWRSMPRASACATSCLHDRRDVVDVELGAVEGAVGGDRSQHLADRLDAPLPRRLGRLDHDGGRAHPEQHPVAAVVEGERGLLDDLVGGCRAGGEEAGPDPVEQRVGRDVVGRDDDDPTAAAGADPVLGERDGLCGARAGRVHLGVRAPRPDDLGELRVSHRQDPEQEPPVELEGLLVCERRRARRCGHRLPPRLRGRRRCGSHRTEGGELLAAGPIRDVALDVGGELAEPRERRREDDAGVVAKRVRAGPTVRGACVPIVVVL